MNNKLIPNDKRFLIGFDMDGTLLKDDDKTISKATLEYLQELSRQGHIIVLASGRPESELRHYHQQLGLSSPIACFNGVATISKNDKDFPPLRFNFPRQWAYQLMDFFIKKLGWDTAFCETDEKIWMYKKDQKVIDFMWSHGADRPFIFGDFKDTLKEDPMTIIFFKHNDRDDREIVRQEVKKYPNADVRFWFGTNIAELDFGKADKALALNHIRKYYGIKKENTIVFGDYLNDIGMIKWAHHGVAMKNAVDEVKKAADYITEDDNNHDGIIATLKSIIESN